MSDFISIPKPSISTGPGHLSQDEATVEYLIEAARRVEDGRIWGSGVSALVTDVLRATADAIAHGNEPCETAEPAAPVSGTVTIEPGLLTMPGMTIGDLLTESEHAVLEQTARLAEALHGVIGEGENASRDWNELAPSIHVLQYAVLSQAAARAYPDRYRLLGTTLRLAKADDEAEQPCAHPTSAWVRDYESGGPRCSICGTVMPVGPNGVFAPPDDVRPFDGIAKGMGIGPFVVHESDRRTCGYSVALGIWVVMPDYAVECTRNHPDPVTNEPADANGVLHGEKPQAKRVIGPHDPECEHLWEKVDDLGQFVHGDSILALRVCAKCPGGQYKRSDEPDRWRWVVEPRPPVTGPRLEGQDPDEVPPYMTAPPGPGYRATLYGREVEVRIEHDEPWVRVIYGSGDGDEGGQWRRMQVRP